MQREERERIYSKRVRAGKRTYFFDVRTTRSRDYYLTITESRRFQKDGDFVYEKSKIFMYKEDFEKFVDALQDTVNHIKQELLPDYDFSQFNNDDSTETFIEGGLVETEDHAPLPLLPEKPTDETTPELVTASADEASDNFISSDLKWE